MNKLQLAEQLRRALQLFAQTLTDDKAMEVATVYPKYEVGKTYNVGEIIRYGENNVGDPQLYRIVQAHTSQEDWLPSITASLYSPIGLTEEGYPIWSQPIGSHDCYNTGDIVDYNGTLYKSLIDGNIFAPDAYPQGWEALVDESYEYKISFNLVRTGEVDASMIDTSAQHIYDPTGVYTANKDSCTLKLSYDGTYEQRAELVIPVNPDDFEELSTHTLEFDIVSTSSTHTGKHWILANTCDPEYNTKAVGFKTMEKPDSHTSTEFTIYQNAADNLYWLISPCGVEQENLTISNVKIDGKKCKFI